MFCDLPSKSGTVLLQWAILTLRRKAQEQNLELSKLGKLRTGLDGVCLEKEVQRGEPETPLCWMSLEMMPLSFLSSSTTFCLRHPCRFGNAATQTWLVALESRWSIRDSWVLMGSSCGEGAWEEPSLVSPGDVGQPRSCAALAGSWKPACRPFSPESSLNEEVGQ